jgi:hypothetical protein
LGVKKFLSQKLHEIDVMAVTGPDRFDMAFEAAPEEE